MHEFPTSDPEPKAESSSDLSSFHLFSQLPAELQFKTWEEAFDATSRFINISVYMVFGFDFRFSPSGSNMCITGGNFLTQGHETDKFRESHRLSLACCDARKVYLLRYPKSIILAKSLEPQGGFIRIRCNPAHDTLCIKHMRGFCHDHDDERFPPLALTQAARQDFNSTRDILSSFQNVAVRLYRDWPSEECIRRAPGPPHTRLTVAYAALFLFSFFESIRHLYFLVKSKNSATNDTVFFRGLPAEGYTPAPVQSFLHFYDLVQRASELGNFNCNQRHRRWRPRPLREIQCYYGRQWLEKE